MYNMKYTIKYHKNRLTFIFKLYLITNFYFERKYILSLTCFMYVFSFFKNIFDKIEFIFNFFSQLNIISNLIIKSIRRYNLFSVHYPFHSLSI